MNKTVDINGQLYDAVTGMPVAKKPATKISSVSKPATKPKLKTSPTKTTTAKPARQASAAAAPAKRSASAAKNLHTPQRRSTTLRRSANLKNSSKTPAKAGSDIVGRKKPNLANPTTKSPAVSKFAAPSAAKTTAKAAAKKPASADVSARKHPSAHKAAVKAARPAKVTAPKARPSKEIKEAAIAKAMTEAKPTKAKKPKSTKAQRNRRLTIIGISLAVAAVLSLCLWIYLPKISVKIASTQAGITAALPSFTPDTYVLQMPVESHSEKVVMTYKNRRNSETFVLTQQKSEWDSEALRYDVRKNSSGQFLTTQDRGLTIFTYNGNAAWVNKGILYTIKASDQTLSKDEIVKIASGL